MLLFCRTLQSHGYNINQLLDYVDTMKDAYAELQINKFNTEFVKVK